MLGIKEGSEEVCRCREVLLESAGTERGVSSWDLPLRGVVGEIGDRRSWPLARLGDPSGKKGKKLPTSRG
jgi:hypothetical protein